VRALQQAFASFLITLLLDGLTKFSAETTLTLYSPIPILGQVFRLALGYNTGVAFGLFANGGPWPLVLTGSIIVGLSVWLVRAIQSGELPSIAGLPVGMILGGAVGNFVDRLQNGQVTDFLDFGLGAARWPTFNLADTFIVLGIAMLLWASLMSKNSEQDQ
jgi:signal peptidase II